MTTIAIPDLSVRASARLGSAYQVAALARRSLRPDLDRYDPQRAPWVRGFFPGDPLPRTKAQPLAAALLDAIAALPADEQALAEQSLCEQRLEQWIALGASPNNAQLAAFHAIWGEIEIPHCPLLASFRPGAAAPIIRPPTTRPPTAPAQPRYTILDTGGVFTSIHRVASPVTSATGSTNGRTQKIARPLFATGLQWSLSVASGGDSNFVAAIPELNWQLSDQVADGGGGRTTPTNTLPLAVLLLDGATIHTEITEQAGSLGDPQMTVHLSYRNVRSNIDRPSLPTFPESYDPPPITGTLWADFTAAAIADLEAAGVILGD